MYKITFLPNAEESFKKLDKPIQKRIAQKIDWLAENADKVVHHTLTSLPDDLRGLCRIEVVRSQIGPGLKSFLSVI
jgi:mRNA-degrading endonuclease RelE of RelBE toxin-antitoxin system